MFFDIRFYLKRIKLLFVILIFFMLFFNVCRGKFIMVDFGMSFEFFFYKFMNIEFMN